MASACMADFPLRFSDFPTKKALWIFQSAVWLPSCFFCQDLFDSVIVQAVVVVDDVVNDVIQIDPVFREVGAFQIAVTVKSEVLIHRIEISEMHHHKDLCRSLSVKDFVQLIHAIDPGVRIVIRIAVLVVDSNDKVAVTRQILFDFVSHYRSPFVK